MDVIVSKIWSKCFYVTKYLGSICLCWQLFCLKQHFHCQNFSFPATQREKRVCDLTHLKFTGLTDSKHWQNFLLWLLAFCLMVRIQSGSRGDANRHVNGGKNQHLYKPTDSRTHKPTWLWECAAMLYRQSMSSTAPLLLLTSHYLVFPSVPFRHLEGEQVWYAPSAGISLLSANREAPLESVSMILVTPANRPMLLYWWQKLWPGCVWDWRCFRKSGKIHETWNNPTSDKKGLLQYFSEFSRFLPTSTQMCLQGFTNLSLK